MGEVILEGILDVLFFVFRLPKVENTKQKPNAPDIILNPNERIIKQYYAAELLRPRSSVYVSVTNQRLLLNAVAHQGEFLESRICQQVLLKNIKGVNTGYTFQTHWIRFLIYLLVFGALGGWVILRPDPLIYLFQRPSFLQIIALIAFGVIDVLFALWLATERLFALEIFSSLGSGAVTLGQGYGEALKALKGEPTGETDQMIEELGALLADLTMNGDDADERGDDNASGGKKGWQYFGIVFPKGYVSNEDCQDLRIPLIQNERPSKIYHAAELRCPACSAYLVVTNQRLLVFGYRRTWRGQGSRIFQQILLSEVNGVNAGYARQISWRRFFFLFVILGALTTWLLLLPNLFADIFGLHSLPKILTFGFFGVLDFLVSLIFSVKSIFALEILSTAINPSLTLGAGYGKGSAIFALKGEPTGNTPYMVSELGALIENTKTNGLEVLKEQQEKKVAPQLAREPEKKQMKQQEPLPQAKDEAEGVKIAGPAMSEVLAQLNRDLDDLSKASSN
jgi:hypothetical protein